MNHFLSRIAVVIFMLIMTQNSLYAWDYINSNINLSLSVAINAEGSGITEKEDDMVYDETGESSGTFIVSYVSQLDLLTPPVLTFANGKFIIKAGLAGRAGYNTYEHYFTYGEDEISELIIDYSFWQVGPSALFIFHHRIFDAGGMLYAYYGPISGDLHAAAGLREAGYPYPESDCETGITGKKLNVGIRNFCALNKGFPVYGGGGVYYSRTEIILDNRLPVYGNDVGKKTISDGLGFELFLGVFF